MTWNNIAPLRLKALFFFCWLLAPLLLFVPLLYLSPVQILGNSDALFYTNILTFITNNVKQGIFFSRWFAEANASFGSPVMFFYAPLAYIITALINLPLTALHLSAAVQLFIGIYASQVVSGCTAFAWLKRSFSFYTAFICSLLFVLLPYKMLYIYLNINLAQLWALAFLPLWMIAAEKMVAGDNRSIGFYALAFAAVYYTHPLTVIAFGLAPAFYVLWCGLKAKTHFLYCKLVMAHLLAIGLCAAQALPQYQYAQWIHTELFIEGKYFWKNNFYHVDVVLCAYYGIIALLIAYALYHLPALRKSAVYYPGVFWIIVLGGVVFLTQRPSQFLWEHIPLLPYLQFPAVRLHAAALMSVVYLIAVWLTYYDTMLFLGPSAYHRLTVYGLIFVFGFATWHYVFKIDTDPEKYNSQYMGEAYASQILPPPEYNTHWGCISAGEAYTLYIANHVPEPVRITTGKAILQNINWKPPGFISFKIEVLSPKATILLRQCYVPLWYAEDENGNRIAIAPDAKQGVISLDLAKGSHVITIHLAQDNIQYMGKYISILALFFVIALMVPKNYLHKTRHYG